MRDSEEIMKEMLWEDDIRHVKLMAEQDLLAARLVELRQSQNIRQDDMPHFSQTSISRIEHRKDIKISTLLEYLDSLGMGVEIKAYPKNNTSTIPMESILLRV